MKVQRGKVYRFYRVVRDNKKMGNLSQELFIKMLKNINRSREVAEKLEADIENAKKTVYTDEFQEINERIVRHNNATKEKFEGKPYEEGDIIDMQEFKSLMKDHKNIIEKANAYMKETEDEEIEINIEKLTEAEYISYVESMTIKGEEKASGISMDDAAFMYDFLVCE